jgi:hypothetical protein
MATPAKKASEPEKGPNLPDDAKESLTASAGHGTPEQKARVVESTGGPGQESLSAPAQKVADEGEKKGYIQVQHDEREKPLGVAEGNEQVVYKAALAQGFIGSQADDTPNEHYTVAGVTSGKPTPENPEGRTGAEQREG